MINSMVCITGLWDDPRIVAKARLTPIRNVFHTCQIPRSSYVNRCSVYEHRKQIISSKNQLVTAAAAAEVSSLHFRGTVLCLLGREITSIQRSVIVLALIKAQDRS
jgi:hypothetical protein